MDFGQDCLAALHTVIQVSQHLKVKAYLGHDAIARHIWNEVYGPPQCLDKADVGVHSLEDRQRLLMALESARPDIRWTTFSFQRPGDTIPSIEMYFSRQPLVWYRCLCRLTQGALELVYGTDAEADLQQGVLRLDQAIFSTSTHTRQVAYVNAGVIAAHQALLEYPGLRLVGLLRQEYEARFGPHEPVTVHTDQDEIQTAVIYTEEKNGGRQVWRHGFTAAERQLAEVVIRFYRTVPRKTSPPPRVPVASLPAALERFRAQGSKNGVEFPFPTGFHSWLHYVACQADDASWREWLRDQTSAHHPWEGHDTWLAGVLSYAAFETYLPKRREYGRQKDTHMGWSLRNHLLWSALMLQTDHLAGFPGLLHHAEVRLALRLAMLCHDAGKLVNCDTAGGHAAWSAKLFLAAKPVWLDEPITQFAHWAINTHDLLGRLSRGLTEKPGVHLHDPALQVDSQPKYRAALDPEAVREALVSSSHLPLETALEVHKAVWLADVGSVASLRWLLPVADLLAAVIRAV